MGLQIIEFLHKSSALLSVEIWPCQHVRQKCGALHDLMVCRSHILLYILTLI